MQTVSKFLLDFGSKSPRISPQFAIFFLVADHGKKRPLGLFFCFLRQSLDGRTTETCLLLDQRYENHNRQLPILGEVERVQLQALGRTQQQSSPQAPSNHPRRPQLQTEDSAFSLTSRAAPPSVVSKSAFSEFFVGSNYTAGSEAHSVVLDLPDRSGKRYLSHQHSLLAFKPSIWSANSLANNMHVSRPINSAARMMWPYR